MNVLFVCSRNQWRSPTAERVWRGANSVSVRSAGTSSSAKRRVTAADLQWADLVFVMEDEHKARLRADFPVEARARELHILDIPDDYRFMDPELIELILRGTKSFIDTPANED